MPTSSAPNRRSAAALLVVVLAACGPRGERPLQGYIEGEYVRVGPQFAGTLQQLSVQRGDQVTAGAPLFALERENEIAARRQSEEQLRGALARLETAFELRLPDRVDVPVLSPDETPTEVITRPAGPDGTLALAFPAAYAVARINTRLAIVTEGTFSLGAYRRFLAKEESSITAFKSQQQAAFDAERERWKQKGQAEYVSEATLDKADAQSELNLPEGAHAVSADGHSGAL